MKRHDYAFPFRIDVASRQGAQASTYEAHVEQMIRQVLLTTPGERVNLPSFGCGLRRLVFAPSSEALSTTAQVVVQQALKRWLADQIDIKQVEVLTTTDSENQVLIRIDYVLRETLATKSMEVIVT
jgi:Bacteriophage baseplate protein W